MEMPKKVVPEEIVDYIVIEEDEDLDDILEEFDYYQHKGKKKYKATYVAS